MVLDMMETLNTRGKRSALVRGGQVGRGLDFDTVVFWSVKRELYEQLVESTDCHKQPSSVNIPQSVCMTVWLMIIYCWMYHKSGIVCKKYTCKHCHQTCSPKPFSKLVNETGCLVGCTLSAFLKSVPAQEHRFQMVLDGILYSKTPSETSSLGRMPLRKNIATFPSEIRKKG